MKNKDLYRININLLIALDIFIEQKSVSKTAEQLLITQSAASKLLSKLRELFQDPILILGKKGQYSLTEYAISLQADLRSSLNSISNLIDKPKKFIPQDFNQEVTFAITNSLCEVLAPKIISKLRKYAPNIRIKVISDIQEGQLGSVNFVIAYEYQMIKNKYIDSQKFVNDKPVCIGHKNHSLMNKNIISAEEYFRQPIIVITKSDSGKILYKNFIPQKYFNKEPNIVCTTPNSLSAIMSLKNNKDMVLVAGELFAKTFCNNFELDYRPIEVDINLPVDIFWPKVYENIHWHQWIREEMLNQL